MHSPSKFFKQLSFWEDKYFIFDSDDELPLSSV